MFILFYQYNNKWGVLYMDTTKQILIQESSGSRKKIKEKEKQKRKITETKKWNFENHEICENNHFPYLKDETKIGFIYQEIRKKLCGYKSQDVEKGKYDESGFSTLQSVLDKMNECELKCFYCKGCVALLYENVREPRQWTLERIDNSIGHNIGNIEISCLSCNLRRRTMHHERYILTKQIQTIKKMT